MEHTEARTESETSKQPQTFTLPPSKLTTKTLAPKTQNYVVQTKRTETILIHIAFSIGLGSIWRFSYLCYWNGGGDFILVYSFMLLLLGIPLLYMEMVMGHWLRSDSIRIWKQLVPLLGGIGYTSILVGFMVSVYSSSIGSWSFFYLANSFYYPLPWTQCPLLKNSSVTGLSCLRTVSQQYFWYQTVLNAAIDIEEGDEHLVPNLTLGILATWLLLFIIIIAGLKISMPILIPWIFLPYLILFCLLVRCLFLEDAISSLKRMMITERAAWASLDLWRQAGGHVLYTLGLGMGTAINISSYNTGGNNSARVALLVAVVNLVTSLLATSIVFIVLGFWASSSGRACVEKSVLKMISLIEKGVLPETVTPPKDILLRPPLEYLHWIEKLPEQLKYQVMHSSPSCSIKEQKDKIMQGPGLAFPTFSQAISLLPGASFWAIVFFLILLVMELNTLIKILESIVFPLQNSISTIRKQPTLIPVVVCLAGFLGSLVFTSRAGSYIMSLFDDQLIPLTLLIIVTIQNVTLAWAYGADRFREEMYGDLGRLMWSFFPFLWNYVTPPGLLALLIISLIKLYQTVPPYYIAWNSSVSQEIEQPFLPSVVGWITFLTIIILLPVPIYPLQRWWFLQDHIASDPFEKLMSKKTAVVPSEWSKFYLAKPSFLPQERKSDDTSMRSSAPIAGRLPNLDSVWELNRPWSQHSRSYSAFSMPFVSSSTSPLSLSNPPSRQPSPTSDRRRETKEESQKKSLQ